MEWLKTHADTIVILGTFATCFWHLNEKMAAMDKELAVIKTVMVMKNIMPMELVATEKVKQ